MVTEMEQIRAAFQVYHAATATTVVISKPLENAGTGGALRPMGPAYGTDICATPTRMSAALATTFRDMVFPFVAFGMASDRDEAVG